MTLTEDLEQHLPLAPHSFQILLSLLDENRHGYSIIKEIEARTEGQTVLGTSTVYASIQRMVKGGLLEGAPTPAADSSGGPRRRYYRITPFGRKVARAEGIRISQLNEMVAATSLMARPQSSPTGEAPS